jgi:hypothetical protein
MAGPRVSSFTGLQVVVRPRIYVPWSVTKTAPRISPPEYPINDQRMKARCFISSDDPW